MPLLESTASADSQCISTAAVFTENTKTGKGGKGAVSAKAHSTSWWSIWSHNTEGYPIDATKINPSGLLPNFWGFCWMLWIFALGAVAFIPSPSIATS